MLRVFDVIYTEKYTIQEKLIYLEACDNLGTFVGEDGKNTTNVTKKIKELLSSSDTRAEGFALLHTVVSQCSTQVFSEEAIAWIQLCTKTIQSNDLPEVKKLCSSVLCQLLQFVSSYSNLCKKVSSSIISPLMESILKISIEDEWKLEALQLLLACMTYFPGPSGNYKIDIEKLILKYIYSWNGKLLDVISQCVALLPLTGGGGNLGLSHSNAWFDQFSSILSSMDLLVEFFNDQSKLDDMDTMVLSSMELPKIPSGPLKAIFYGTRLYQFLGFCLRQMLSTNLSVSVKIPVNAVLSHICQSLALRSSLDEQINLDKITLSSMLPSQHIVSLNLLKSLILCCGDTLIPNSGLINSVLLQSLEWSTNEDEGEDVENKHFYSNLRKCVYQVLQAFVKKLGSNSLTYEAINSFFSQIYLDIKTKVDEVKLLKKSKFNDASSRSNMKKKRRIAIDVDQIAPEESHKLTNPDCDWETVKESLAALGSIIYACGPIFKDEIHRDIQKTIVTLLLNVQQNSNQIPVPYSNPLCRKELYRVLLACLVCPNSSFPPPYQPAIRLFSIGQRDSIEIVSDYCTEALSICGSLAHPAVAPLQFYAPLQIQGSYGSEASETVSNEADSYQEDRDSIMEEDEEEEYGERYPGVGSSIEAVEEVAKKYGPTQPKLIGPSKPSLPVSQKPVSQIQILPERQLHPTPTIRNKVTFVHDDEEVEDIEEESKTMTVRNRINTPLRASIEERKPVQTLVQQNLRKEEENRILQKQHPQGVNLLVEPSRNSQPRPKSVQNVPNAKISHSDHEVLDVSEEVVEMEGGSEEEEEEEDYDEEEDDEEGHYEGHSLNEDSEEDYYEQGGLNERDDDEEDSREDFMNRVYGENIVCYSVEGKPTHLAEGKQEIAKKGQIPVVQQSIPKSNNIPVNVSNSNQRIIKTTAGVLRMEDCNVIDSNEKSAEISQIIIQNVSSIKPQEVNPQPMPRKNVGPLKNESHVNSKMNDSLSVSTASEQNHVAENSSQILKKDSDIHVVDICSPLKDKQPIQTLTESSLKVVTVDSGSLIESEVEQMDKQPFLENNISLAVKSLKSPEESVIDSSSNLNPELLNQKSPLNPEEVTDYAYSCIEECVEEVVDDDDEKHSVEDAGDVEAKKSSFPMEIEEKGLDVMLKDFNPCPKDD